MILDKINLETRLKRRPDLVASNMDGETVMLDMESGQYFGMDAIGSVIWDKLQMPTSVADLCHALQAEFEVDAKTCEQDVSEFLQELVENGLLEVVE